MAVVTTDTVKISTCKNEKVTLRPGGGVKFKWQDGSTANFFDVVADVNKMVSVTVVHTIDTSNIVFAVIPINCNINAGPDVSICKGSTTKLTATTNGTFKEWTPVTNLSTSTNLSTNANPQTTTKYVASAIFPAQNLILNGDFEKGFQSFGSDYVYGDSVLIYGYYVIGKNPYPYGPSWARNFTDHTSGTGRMMIVDGSETVGQDVYKTTVFVHKGDNYVFSTWIKNVKEGLDNPAKLSFYINGQSFGSINLPIGESNWVYFNTFWTAPTDTTITISIKNQNTSGIGNDFAFDDMVFSDYVTKTDTVVVTVNPIPTVTATTSKPTICVGESVTLTGNNATTYVWNNSVINNIAFKPTTTRTYNVTGTDANGCENTASISVIVNALPPVKAVANPTTICLNESSTLTATGAVTYLWSNGIANGVSISPTSTQTYSVTGTDSKGCVNTASTTVTVNPLPTIAATSQTICIGKSTVLNATGASSYIWDNGVVNNVTFSPTSTKTYSVTGTDTKGCVSTSTASVLVNPLPVLSVVTGPTTLCFGQSTKLSGQGAQTYIWDNTVSDNISFAPTTTKTYTVTGTDINGCISKTTSVVTVNALPTITALSQTICIGQTTKLQGVGGVSYIWSGGISNNTDFNPITTTIYTVTGTDVNGCINNSTATVTVNPLPTIAATSQTICIGKSTVLNATGASSYIWDNGVVNNTTFSPTSTKTYSVTGTDTKGCVSTSTASVLVNPLPVLSVVTGPTTLCFGQSTKLSGQGAQTYIWDNTVSDNISFAPTTTKTYTVTGTDINGCISKTTSVVTVNALPTITALSQTICIGQTTKLQGVGGVSYIWSGGISNNTDFNPITTTIYTVTGTDVNGCINNSTATVTVNPLPTIAATSQTICIGKSTVLNATGASSYIWDNGVVNNTTFSPTSTKTYSVTGTDTKGCVSTSTASVLVNPLPVLSVVTGPTTLCFGQSTKLSGQGAQTYIWDNTVSDNISFAPTTTKTYTVTGTDINGCISKTTSVVTVNALPTITALSQTICIGQTTKLQGVGGVSYIWSGGISNNTDFNPITTTIYTVTGTDVNGCINNSSATVTVNPLPTISATSQTICIGKSTVLNATGASSYIWDNGVVNNVTFSPTSTKTYSVTGTDTKGCVSTSTASVLVNPLPVLSVVTGPTTLCFGQSTKLSGQGAQTYIWDNTVSDNISFAPTTTKTYTVTGTDINGCISKTTSVVTVNALPTITALSQTICIGQTTKLQGVGGVSYVWGGGISNNTTFNPNSTLLYTVTGTDINGCQNTSSATVIVNPLPTITATSKTICYGQSTKLNGIGAVSYSWNNGILDNATFIPTVTTTYSVTGTDSKSCTNTYSAIVTVNPLPNVTAASKTICIGQPIILDGAGADSYVWNKDVMNSISFTPAITDTYTVTGTDVNGCKNTATATVTLNPLPTISANAETVCFGQSTTLRANGAVSYVWDGGITNNVSFTPNSSSMFHVTGTDANGCKNGTVTTVIVNPLPVLSYGAIPQICDYANSVTIDYASPVGGTYSGLGVSGLMFDPAIAGTGIHTIEYSYTNTNGCTNTISQTITVNTKPVLLFDLDAQRCYDAGLLQLSANPSGGVFSGTGVVGQTFNPTIPTSEVPVPIRYGYTDPTTGCTDTITKNIIVHYTPPPVVHNVQTSTIDLQTSIPAIGDGTMRWYDNSSLSTLLYVGNPYYHGYTNTVYRYYYITQVINGCESISDTMILKIVSCGTPVPIVNTPTIKCMYQNLDTVKVQNTIINNKKATVIWRDVNDIIVSNSAAFVPNFTQEGTITYQVSLDTSGCEGAGVNVTWERYKTPKPIVAPVPSPCHGFAIPSFTATNIYGTVKWYNTATLDTLVGTGNTFKTKDPNTILQYYWVTNNDMCVSEPVRVQLVIYPKPPPPYGDLLYESCQGSPIETMVVKPSIGTTWYDVNNQIIGTSLPSYTPPVATLKLDQKVRYSTIYFDGHCYSDPFTFDYLLKRKPLKPKLHPDTICLGSNRVELGVASGNNVTWNFPALQKKYNGLKIKPDITTIGTFTYNVWDELNGCISDTATDSVVAGPTPHNTLVGPTKICENTFKQPFSVTSRNAKSSFIWTVTGDRPNYKASASAQFYRNIDFKEPGIDTIYVTEINEFGCSGKDSAIIRIAPKPDPNFLYEVPYENYKYNFYNITDSLYITDGDYKELLPLSFNWNFGRETDTLVAESWKQYVKDTMYKQNYAYGAYKILLMANPNGYQCPDTITKQIYIDVREALYVPTAFTPDHPSPNLSVFTAKGYNLKSFKMWIYDFWGNLLFFTDKLYNGQPLEGWDGSFNGVIQKVDSYVWRVEAEFVDGMYWKGQKDAKTEGNVTFGNLLLLR